MKEHETEVRYYVKMNEVLLKFVKETVIEVHVPVPTQRDGCGREWAAGTSVDIAVENPDVTSERGAVYFDYHGTHYRVDDRYHVEEKTPHGYVVSNACLFLKAALRHRASLPVKA